MKLALLGFVIIYFKLSQGKPLDSYLERDDEEMFNPADVPVYIVQRDHVSHQHLPTSISTVLRKKRSTSDIFNENIDNISEDDISAEEKISADLSDDEIFVDYLEQENRTAREKRHVRYDNYLYDYPSGRAVVELMIVIDHQIYNRFLHSERNDQRKALISIRTYYTLLVSLVNLRYGGLRKLGIDLHVVPIGIVVPLDRQSARWSELNMLPLKYYPHKLGIDSTKSLNDFRMWMRRHLHALPEYDHAVSLTGNTLTRSGVTSTKGMAFVGQICELEHGYSSSIVEDQGGFSNVGTVTHELGHSLGAVHDGTTKAPECSASDNNIMAPTNNMRKTAIKNFWDFSRCTVRSILDTLRKRRAKCLYHTTPMKKNNHVYVPMPGQLVSPDEQCRQIFGPKSGFCAVSESLVKEMCFRLWCRKPHNPTQCTTSGHLTAAYGATCADRKWCIKGECVYDYRAPRMKDCHFGDMNAQFCQTVILMSSENCRDPHIRQQCCKLCGKYRTT